jgi:hypothetical protein
MIKTNNCGAAVLNVLDVIDCSTLLCLSWVTACLFWVLNWTWVIMIVSNIIEPKYI